MKQLASIVPLLVAASAFAHDGHGVAEWHWHATDSAGFVFLLVVAAIALWASRDQ
jgi:hypothetical protein